MRRDSKARESSGTSPPAQENPQGETWKRNQHAGSHNLAYLTTLTTTKHEKERRTDGEEKKGEQTEPRTTEEAEESESREGSARERELGEILGGEDLEAEARSAGRALEDCPCVFPVKG